MGSNTLDIDNFSILATAAKQIINKKVLTHIPRAGLGSQEGD